MAEHGMTFPAFRRSLAGAKPPADLSPALAALWWAGKEKWDKAHGIVMNSGGRDCAWVHAHLHRVEGDLGNAGYWYGQARRKPSTRPPATEWETIVRELLDTSEQ
jgi:hypothetical protein